MTTTSPSVFANRPILSTRAVCSSGLCRNWTSGYHALRDTTSNAIDACPEMPPAQLFSITADGSVLLIETPTSPTLLEITSVGEGSKDIGGSTIGQFGGGFKESVATFLREGCTVVVHSRDFDCEFVLLDEGGRFPTVMCNVYAPTNPSGFRMVVTGPPGTFDPATLQTLYLHPRPTSSCAIPKPPSSESSPASIYCKGVFVTRVSSHSLYDYNIDTLTINRDRTVPNTNTLETGVGNLAMTDPAVWSDLDLISMLKAEPSTVFERRCLKSIYWTTESFKQRFVAALRAIHGPDCLLPSSRTKFNEIATAAGKTVVFLPDFDSFTRVLGDFPSVDSWLRSRPTTRVRSSTPAPESHTVRIRRALQRIAPHLRVTVRYFDMPSDDEFDGNPDAYTAIIEESESGRAVIWLPLTGSLYPSTDEYAMLVSMIAQATNNTSLDLGDLANAADISAKLLTSFLNPKK